LFERSKHSGSSIHQPAKRTKLHLFGILGAIVGIIAAVGIILVLTQMKAEKQIQAPLQIEEKQNNAERPLCNNKGTYLLCMCLVGRKMIGTCNMNPSDASSPFYESFIENGNLKGDYSSSDYWLCSWNKMTAFAHFVPLQNLCGDVDAQTKYCEEAAKMRPECNISINEGKNVDIEMVKCSEKAQTMCKGESQSLDIQEYVDASSLVGGST